VSQADDFRKKAADCRLMAAATARSDDREIWLRLAEDWLWRARQSEKKATTQSSLARRALARRNSGNVPIFFSLADLDPSLGGLIQSLCDFA